MQTATVAEEAADNESQMVILEAGYSLCPLQLQISVCSDRKWNLTWALMLESIHLRAGGDVGSAAFLLTAAVKSGYLSDHRRSINSGHVSFIYSQQELSQGASQKRAGLDLLFMIAFAESQQFPPEQHTWQLSAPSTLL